jgi:hypothetical protein
MITAILILIFTTNMVTTGSHRKRCLPMLIGIPTQRSYMCMTIDRTCTIGTLIS